MPSNTVFVGAGKRFIAATVAIALTLTAAVTTGGSPASAVQNGAVMTSGSTAPWFTQVMIHVNKRKGKDPEWIQCGGVLISPSYVLTAQHCFHHNNTTETDSLGPVIATSEATVSMVIGATKITRDRVGFYHAEGGGTVATGKAWTFPSTTYAPNEARGDIALVQLDRAVTSTPPITLATDVDKYAAAKALTVLGRGGTLPDDPFLYSAGLTHSGIPAGRPDIFKTLPGAVYNIDTGAKTYQCFTHGDSGSPIMDHPSATVWTVLGPVSGGTETGCTASWFGYGTRADYYRSWIDGRVSGVRWQSIASPATPTTPAPPAKPAAPVLSLIGKTTSSVTLSWTAVPGATGYRVYDDSTQVTTTTGTTATLTGLSASTTHAYTVIAYNNGGDSPRSNGVTVSTLPSYLYTFVSQTATNPDGSAGADLAHARPGQSFIITIALRNTGTATWTSGGPNPVLLATARPNDHAGLFRTAGWVSTNRAARLQETSRGPGEIGTFRFTVTAPAAAGATTEYFTPVAEDASWFNDAGLSVTIITTPVIGVSAAGTQGQWLAASDGGVFTQGDAPFFGSKGGQQLNAPVVAVAGTPTGRGYWLAGADGGVFTFGDAAFYGSTASQPLAKPIVGMAVTPTGRGYWLVGADGGVFAYGDAPFAGSMAGRALNATIVGIAGTPTGRGYRLVGADGGVFAFGDASFAGSMAGRALNAPITGITSDPLGNGYWLVGRDGGIYAFEAPFLGSGGAGGSAQPVIGMTARTAGYGYTDAAGNYSGFPRGGAANGPADGMLFKEVSSDWVYLCYGGAKFRIPDAPTFDAMHLSWAAIRTLPDGGISAVADIPRDGTVLREMTSPNVYRVENGRKRLVALPEFTANNYGAVLRYVPDGGLNQIPTA